MPEACVPNVRMFCISVLFTLSISCPSTVQCPNLGPYPSFAFTCFHVSLRLERVEEVFLAPTSPTKSQSYLLRRPVVQFFQVWNQSLTVTHYKSPWLQCMFCLFILAFVYVCLDHFLSSKNIATCIPCHPRLPSCPFSMLFDLLDETRSVLAAVDWELPWNGMACDDLHEPNASKCHLNGPCPAFCLGGEHFCLTTNVLSERIYQRWPLGSILSSKYGGGHSTNSNIEHIDIQI